MEKPMNLTTKKLPGGVYRVYIDGKATGIVIDKGESPKFGYLQEWEIGVLGDGDIRWLIGDQRGKAMALETITLLLKAAT
jgi:hypothetical protein